MVMALTVALMAPAPAPASPESTRFSPPRVPPGIEPCTAPLRPPGPMPRNPGETLRYLVDVDGLSVGTIDFKIERRGRYQGRAVIEYRSLFELDALAAAFVEVTGRAASLVPDTDSFPVETMNDFTWGNNHYEEEASYEPEIHRVRSKRSKNGKMKERRRRFSDPVLDFLTGFYAMRTMNPDTAGCSILYSHQRAMTIWVTPAGRERVETPTGSRLADRFDVLLASERSKKPYDGAVWLGPGPDRVPYRAELQGKKHHMAARIHMFVRGGKAHRLSSTAEQNQLSRESPLGSWRPWR